MNSKKSYKNTRSRLETCSFVRPSQQELVNVIAISMPEVRNEQNIPSLSAYFLSCWTELQRNDFLAEAVRDLASHSRTHLLVQYSVIRPNWGFWCSVWRMLTLIIKKIRGRRWWKMSWQGSICSHSRPSAVNRLQIIQFHMIQLTSTLNLVGVSIWLMIQ